MSLFESTLLSFCKPQSKFDLPTLHHGSRERKNSTEQIINVTLARIWTQVLGSSRRCSTNWATVSAGRFWILILISFSNLQPIPPLSRLHVDFSSTCIYIYICDGERILNVMIMYTVYIYMYIYIYIYIHVYIYSIHYHHIQYPFPITGLGSCIHVQIYTNQNVIFTESIYVHIISNSLAPTSPASTFPPATILFHLFFRLLPSFSVASSSIYLSASHHPLPSSILPATVFFNGILFHLPFCLLPSSSMASSFIYLSACYRPLPWHPLSSTYSACYHPFPWHPQFNNFSVMILPMNMDHCMQ